MYITCLIIVLSHATFTLSMAKSRKLLIYFPATLKSQRKGYLIVFPSRAKFLKKTVAENIFDKAATFRFLKLSSFIKFEKSESLLIWSGQFSWTRVSFCKEPLVPRAAPFFQFSLPFFPHTHTHKYAKKEDRKRERKSSHGANDCDKHWDTHREVEKEGACWTTPWDTFAPGETLTKDQKKALWEKRKAMRIFLHFVLQMWKVQAAMSSPASRRNTGTTDVKAEAVQTLKGFYWLKG